MTNVFRHSGADKASVVIEKSDREIIVAVRDNGKGLGENIVEFRPGSIGIGTVGNGLLTANGKLKRDTIAARFSNEIEQMYAKPE